MTDTEQPGVTVVTVNYNHASYLPSYIDSLRASRYPLTAIIIVDNGSTDDSLAILARYPDVTVVANKENIGYSAALNQAFQQASSPLVCATGPDVEVDPDWLLPLIEQYRRDPEGVFAVASRVLTLDRRAIQSAGGSLHFTGHLCVFDMWQPVENGTAQETPCVVGAIDSTSMLVDRAKFLQIGGCDRDFFVYHEEFDYCYRARMRGWQCWYHPQSQVYHGDGSHEFSVRSSGAYPRMRPFLHTRNRLLAILKDYQIRTLVGIIPILLLIETLNYVMLIRVGLHTTYHEALGWIWQHRKEIMLKRAVIQPERTISDRDLLTADALTITPLLLQTMPLRVAKRILDVILGVYWTIVRRMLYGHNNGRSTQHPRINLDPWNIATHTVHNQQLFQLNGLNRTLVGQLAATPSTTPTSPTPTTLDLPPPPPGRTGWPWDTVTQPPPSTMPDGRAWPRISIVTPSYNQAHFLEETLRSVLLQGYPNLEYIVIDGGSNDGSTAILERYTPWLNDWVSEPDRGQAHAINKGFQRTTGDLIGWINSDDLLLPGSLQRFAEAYRDHPDSLLLGDVNFVDAQGVLIRRVAQTNVTFEGMVKIWQLGMHWCQPGTCIPRVVYEQAGALDERLRYVFDRDWMCRLLAIAPVHYLQTPTAQFRMHDSSKTVSENDRWLPEQIGVTRRYWDRVPDLDRRRALAELELSGTLTYINLTSRRNRRRGLQQLARVALIDPRILLVWRFWMLFGAALTPRPLLQAVRHLAPADLGGW
jgi:GT2 family glycosyltransferase